MAASGIVRSHQPGETVDIGGVVILGPENVASTVPSTASQMYARNIVAFLQNLVKAGEIKLDTTDEVIRETLLTVEGKVVSREG